MMQSDRRLHPLSFLFHVGGQLQQLVIPGLVLLVGAGSAGLDWQAWLAVLVIPYAIFAFLKCLSFRYRFDATELVMTSGFIFRNERHVPYGRIQNIDARQNVFHRLLRVVEVRVETGGGDEPEAAMRVLPLAALTEMRERVFAGRMSAAGRTTETASAEIPPAEMLLQLRARDLLLAGFIDSRGLVIVGAAFGLLWEAGLFDPTIDMVFGENVSGRGLMRQVARAVFGGGVPHLSSLALMVGALIAVLLAMRLLSMIWSLVRLHGFRLDRAGDDVRAEFGLFTRVMSTIPLRRIQTLTIREGPLHRLFKAASVRVDSAGGDAGAAGAAKRESLAPIIEQRLLPQLLRDVLPEVDLTKVEWQSVDPRGFRRAFRAALIFYALLTIPFIAMLKAWTLALLAALSVWAYVDARLHIKHLGWAIGDRAVLFRSGWLFRQLTIARFTKIQAVALGESPFDRRHRMASVRVDTAGAADLSHKVAIPYLSRDTAATVYARLSAEAARTSFRW
jgi:putative membrane protein